MTRLFEDIARREAALKKLNPKASLKWQRLYYEGLKYASTPADVQNMSLGDLLEFVGQKKRHDAEFARKVAELLKDVNKNPDKRGSADNFKYPEEKRREIVEEYRYLKSNGLIQNKHSWAMSNHVITGKTLYRWEKEFPIIN